MPGKRRWTAISSYAGGLDQSLLLDKIQPWAIPQVEKLHRDMESLRIQLANRERQLIKLKRLGLKSIHHEQKDGI